MIHIVSYDGLTQNPERKMLISLDTTMKVIGRPSRRDQDRNVKKQIVEYSEHIQV